MDKYRQEVMAFLITTKNKFVLVHAHSYSKDSFCSPKGGIHKDETPEKALVRELIEELNLTIYDYDVLFKSAIKRVSLWPKEIQKKYGKLGSEITCFWVRLKLDSYQPNLNELEKVIEVTQKKFETSNKFRGKDLELLKKETLRAFTFTEAPIETPFVPYMAIPFVGAIIERVKDGQVELLIQTRSNIRDQIYSGTIEFPAGSLDRGFENIYDTIKREIKEETGLILKRIKNDSQTKVFSQKGNDAAFGFRPFCNVQQLKNGRPWVGFIFLCEVENGEFHPQKNEVKNIRWIKREELKKIFETTPEKLFTVEIPAWEYYFRN